MARPSHSSSRLSSGNVKVGWVLSIVLFASRAKELLSYQVSRGYGTEALAATHEARSTMSAGFTSARLWPCGRGIRTRSSDAWGRKIHCCPRIAMSVGEEGEELGGPRPKKKRALGLLSTGINDAILELCVENKGRPLARAMTDFVEYAIEALASGYSAEALLLELQFLDSTTRVPGQTLTGVEKRYRTQWIVAMHAVMQHLKYVEQQEPRSAEEFHIKSQVDVVLRGRMNNDEQTFVKFDKALATGGVAGGVATERIVVSPQMVPISQLTLLAIRALQKMEDAAAA